MTAGPGAPKRRSSSWGSASVNFTAGSLGEPLFARPFFNVQTGAEDAELIANRAVPSLPGLLPLTGRVTTSSFSRMWGVEGNGLRGLAEGCNYQVDLLGGFRYLRLDEGLRVGEDLLVPANSRRRRGSAS